MELHFSHASRVLATRPLPLEATRLVLTGDQPKLTQLFAKRFEHLTKLGLLGVETKRLVDRRPVEMKPSTTTYNPPQKPKVRSTQAIVHDHPWLTDTQRKCRTSTTLGKPIDMTNRVQEQRDARRARWLSIKSDKAAS